MWWTAIWELTRLSTSSVLWTIPKTKKQGGWRWQGIFREGYQRNCKWKFWGLIKKEVKFPGVIKKKLCEVFRSLGSLPQNLLEGVTHVEFSVVKVVLSCSGISKGKVTNLEIPAGVFSKKYVLNHLCLNFFWNNSITTCWVYS